LLLSLVVSSCSTKKNKWNRRVYHNLTAHYNAYFNGVEALKEAKENIAEAHVDDYTQVLDVFQLGTKDAAMASAANLDRAVMKASLVIHKHSMFFRKKEQVKWVYYSYLLMAQARFYKQEYGTSKQILRYIVTKYPKEKVKQDALLWIALIESTTGNYENAISQLDAIRSKISSGQVSKESYRMLPKVYADAYIRQKNYDAAIPYLIKAVDRANKKTEKARLLFILGQLQQQRGNSDAAIAYYLKVLKKNPSYEMDFNARMNMAKSYKGGDSKLLVKKLNKMLKDIKNKEYQDQIYYVLAEIALKDKDKPTAINYLKMSVKTSVNNNKQKAFSALKLAEIYFQDEKYKNAQSYYDSTMMFLPKDYPDYTKLNDRKKILTELVNNLIIIQTEDSLQKLANMSASKRNKLIDGYIQAEIEAEKKKAAEEQERMAQLQFALENKQEETQLKSVTDKSAPKWYFYNPSSVSSGFTEFMAKWGQRKLTDNWRLSDKEIVSFDDSDDENTSDTSQVSGKDAGNTGKKSSNRKTREYYLQNIPLTQEMMDSSNARVENAIFAAAIIYKEKLLNNPKAQEMFDESLRRFPKGKYTDQVYYNMYRIYMVEGNKGDANYYRKKLINEYPDSDYAKILQDPDYFKKLQEQANMVTVKYKSTYQLYINKQYKQVQKNCADAKVQFPNNKKELSKFEMLNALCVGVKRDTAAFIAALQVVVDDYPNSEVKPKAEEMIALLKTASKTNIKKEGKQGNTEESKPDKKSIFTYNPDETHMFLVLADKRNVKISELKNRLSNHNTKYFGTEHLTVSAIPINANILLIGVSNFKNKDKAMEYFNTAKRNSLLYVMLKKNGGNFFIISEGNYARLYKSKDLDGYRAFYDEKYPQGK
jgi:tetratricopeptide (TPR) repeat protein